MFDLTLGSVVMATEGKQYIFLTLTLMVFVPGPNQNSDVKA